MPPDHDDENVRPSCEWPSGAGGDSPELIKERSEPQIFHIDEYRQSDETLPPAA